MQSSHLLARQTKVGQDRIRVLPDSWRWKIEPRRSRREPRSWSRLNDAVARDEGAAGNVVRVLWRLGHRQDGHDASVDSSKQLLGSRPCARRELRLEPEPERRPRAPVVLGARIDIVDHERALERGDRVLFFTDGVIEEDRRGGAESGETRLRNLVERVGDADEPVQETVRLLSRALMQERGGVTSDDATLLLLEWRGGSADHVGIIDEPPAARG